ncbi:MAG: tetratricopeptide repeat protein, partial [Tepidisphaeraceae bacterium]
MSSRTRIDDLAPPVRRAPRAIAPLLVVATFIVFGRAAVFEFNTWDDQLNIAANPLVQSLTWANVKEIWSRPVVGQYIPVTYTTWAVVGRLAGVPSPDAAGLRLNPYVFHLFNVCVHAVNVLIVWRILRRLPGIEWAAALGALVFGLHPLRVEAVAWVTGLKDLLGGLFALLAIWQYLEFASARHDDNDADAEDGRARHGPRPSIHYALATFAFAAAVLSKPTAIVAPAIAWVLVYWRDRPPFWASVLPLAPWALVAVAPAYMASTGPMQAGGKHMVWSPLWARPLIAVDTIAFYLTKLVAPYPLAFDYGRTPTWVRDSGLLRVTWLVPVALAVALFALQRRVSWLVMSAAVFVIGLLPVLGLVPFEYQSISTPADRYTYLAALGPSLAVTVLLCRLPEARRHKGYVVAGVVVTILAALSAHQVGAWRDTQTLARRGLQVNPDSSTAHHNLGLTLRDAGRLDEAEAHLRRAVATAAPYRWQPYEALGRLLVSRGRGAEAETVLADSQRIAAEYVLAQYPDHSLGLRRLGAALLRLGRTDEAVVSLRRAVQVDPASAGAHNDLAHALLRRGDTTGAEREFDQALRLDPSLEAAKEGLERAR